MCKGHSVLQVHRTLTHNLVSIITAILVKKKVLPALKTPIYSNDALDSKSELSLNSMNAENKRSQI
jgi:hypothetical protein